MMVALKFLQTQKGLELLCRSQFLQNFLIKFFFGNITKTGQIALTDCVYFRSYSVKCISCFR